MIKDDRNKENGLANPDMKHEYNTNHSLLGLNLKWLWNENSILRVELLLQALKTTLMDLFYMI